METIKVRYLKDIQTVVATGCINLKKLPFLKANSNIRVIKCKDGVIACDLSFWNKYFIELKYVVSAYSGKIAKLKEFKENYPEGKIQEFKEFSKKQLGRDLTENELRQLYKRLSREDNITQDRINRINKALDGILLDNDDFLYKKLIPKPVKPLKVKTRDFIRALREVHNLINIIPVAPEDLSKTDKVLKIIKDYPCFEDRIRLLQAYFRHTYKELFPDKKLSTGIYGIRTCIICQKYFIPQRDGTNPLYCPECRKTVFPTFRKRIQRHKQKKEIRKILKQIKIKNNKATAEELKKAYPELFENLKTK